MRWRTYRRQPSYQAVRYPDGRKTVTRRGSRPGVWTRTTTYPNGAHSSGGFSGSFYSFRVGSVMFISLDANDVAYQDSGAFTTTAQATPTVTIPANTGVYNRQ